MQKTTKTTNKNSIKHKQGVTPRNFKHHGPRKTSHLPPPRFSTRVRMHELRTREFINNKTNVCRRQTLNGIYIQWKTFLL